ncbi:MAG: 2-hydroxychromene-2-carboxylate isomerase [Alphaproteobacteria bacterium]|nr:2-hydroxychromene-2-carboxylate isomerase [Alphaproteobacteria bacterium]
MLKLVDYYFSPSSPFAYMGHQRFLDLILASEGALNLKPVDFGRIFPVSGGLPLAKRPPQRLAYRLQELHRWRDHLGIELNPEPKFFPVDSTLAALVILAAANDRSSVAPGLAFDLMRAVWAEERNIADPETVKAVIRAKGLPPDELLERAAAPEIRATYDALTQEAIDCGVFGSPTYVFGEQMFWGQDRLDFLQRALEVK